jgi:biotin carboxyl carrier protein
MIPARGRAAGVADCPALSRLVFIRSPSLQTQTKPGLNFLRRRTFRVKPGEAVDKGQILVEFEAATAP